MGDNSGGDGPPDKNSDSNMSSSPVIKPRVYDLENRYQASDNGPFFVMVEHKDKNVGRLFPIRIGHYLLEDKKVQNNIIDIKSIGFNRVKIICKTFETANNLIEHENFTKNNLIAYIPKYYTHKKGIIRMVDTMFTEEYILKAVESNIHITEVKRMKRKIINDGTATYVDRQMVILTFLGNRIPDNVKINLVNFPVDPYFYPVVQCYKCLRYGHTSMLCRGKARCKVCAAENCSDDPCINNGILCVHCKSVDHSSVSKNCPIFKKQTNIKKVMATENVTFREAEFVVDNPSYAKITTHNRFSLLSDTNNYPALPEPKTNFILKKPTPKKQATSNQNFSPLKKRKASSPLQTPPTVSKVGAQKASSSILPNPHRNDFMEFKEKILTQVVQFVQNAIYNNQFYDETNLKNSICQILDSPYFSNEKIDTYTLSDSDASEY